MPGRLERHARSKDGYGSEPARSSQVHAAASADPDPSRRAPGRKDTRRWCRGKPGVEHRLVMVVHATAGRECGC